MLPLFFYSIARGAELVGEGWGCKQVAIENNTDIFNNDVMQSKNISMMIYDHSKNMCILRLNFNKEQFEHIEVICLRKGNCLF